MPRTHYPFENLIKSLIDMETNLSLLTDTAKFQQGKITTKSSLKELTELAAYGRSLPPIRRIFGNYVVEGSAIIFAAERGTGKTWLGFEICIAVASEWNNFLGEPIEVHGNTLFINCELSEQTMAKRAATLEEYPPHPTSFKNYKCHVYSTRNSLDEEVEAIFKMAQLHKPVLIVLDNFRVAFLNADTNSNKDVAKAMQLLLNLKDILQTTIIITDHTRKHTKSLLTDSDLQSGSGVKSDLVDSDMFLRRSKQSADFRIFKRVKSRHTEESNGAKLIKLNPKTLWFEFVEDNVDESEHIGADVKPKNKEEEKEIALELQEKGKSIGDIAKILNRSKSTIHGWLNK